MNEDHTHWRPRTVLVRWIWIFVSKSLVSKQNSVSVRELLSLFILWLLAVKPTVTINFHAATGYLSVSPETSIIGMVSGGDLVLPYQVSGSPKPTHEWLHLNSTPISIIHSNFNESHLTLRIVSQSDSGIYKVVVRNSLGEAEASFSLSVQSV